MKTMKKLCIIAAIALLVEITICQYASYMTLGNQPIQDRPYEIYSGGEWNEDGSITITDTLKIEMNDINEEVNAIKFRFSRRNAEKEEKEVNTVWLYATDEANQDYFLLGERRILEAVPQSQYMKLHLSGNCTGIIFVFSGSEGSVVNIEEFILNPKIPFSLSGLRFLLLMGMGLFVVFAGSKGKYFAVMWDGDSKVQRRITLAVIAAQLVLFTGAVLLNPAFREAEWDNHKQYHRLAEALTRGQLYLLEEPPAGLASMENPYDSEMRNKLMEETGESYLWDTAYYNGKYYVYFGVVPVMLFYLPWYLLTKTPFPTWLGIWVTGIIFVAAVFWLSGNLVRKYFHKGVPYVGWLLSTLLMINGCGALTIMRRPDFYSLPILMAVTLSVGGISFWISSLEENEIRTWKLVAGCFCMALVAGCRPQLLLGSFLIFPIYWKAVFQDRLLFSRKTIGRTVGAILPYVLVAAGLMIYNVKRFDSPFDFGAMYNLTTNDMTRRGMEWGRLPQGFWIYLFQLPNLTAKFPYIQVTSEWSSYLGKIIWEQTFGGFFPVNLMVAATPFLLWKRRWFANQRLHWTAVAAFGMGILICCIDTQVAGVLLRYYSDFGWLFYLAALIAWFAAWEHNRFVNDRNKLLRYGQNVAFAVGTAFYFLLLFTDGSDSILETAPGSFYSFYYQLAFWA